MGSISQGHPARWTATIALVAGVQTARIESAVMFPESRSTSAQTGRAPKVTAQLAEAINVRLAVITSSPGTTPSARNASSRATVPLATATAYWQPANLANSSSN